MTIQTLIFLHQIKYVQMSESGEVWIDEDNKKMVTVIDDPDSSRKTCSLARKWHAVDSMSRYLEEENLLDYNGALGYMHLNFKGYHYIQAVIVDFLLKSIAVPILVAVATTLITLWLQGFF